MIWAAFRGRLRDTDLFSRGGACGFGAFADELSPSWPWVPAREAATACPDPRRFGFLNSDFLISESR